MSSVPTMKCLVCGIPDTTRHVFPTLEDTCSPCFAWSVNYLEALNEHDLTGIYPDFMTKPLPRTKGRKRYSKVQETEPR